MAEGWLCEDGVVRSTEEVWAYEMAFARIPWWRRLLGERPSYPPRPSRSTDG